MVIETKESGFVCESPDESKKAPDEIWIILSQINPPVSEKERELIQTLIYLTEPDFPQRTLEDLETTRRVLNSAQTQAEELSGESFYQQEPARRWKGHLDGFSGVLDDILLLKLTGQEDLFKRSFSVLNEQTRDFLTLRTDLNCTEGKISVFENESEAYRNP